MHSIKRNFLHSKSELTNIQHIISRINYASFWGTTEARNTLMNFNFSRRYFKDFQMKVLLTVSVIFFDEIRITCLVLLYDCRTVVGFRPCIDVNV